MTPINVIAVVVTLTFLMVIVRMVRQRKLRAKYSFLWLPIGAVVLVCALFPPLMERFSLMIGVYYPPAMLFLGAIMLLLFVAVHFSWELSRMEERSRILAEDLALAWERIERLAPTSSVDGHAPAEARDERIATDA